MNGLVLQAWMWLSQRTKCPLLSFSHKITQLLDKFGIIRYYHGDEVI